MRPLSILVTGSSGTIGTELTERLLASDHQVYPVDTVPNRWSAEVEKHTTHLDLCDVQSLEELPSDIDLVVHLAANARVHALVQNPGGAKENIDMTFNVLEYAREVGANIVFGSSREVYGNNGKIIYSEEDTYVDECESPYTASKIAGESLIKSYENCYDIEACTLRFSNVYGRYDASNRVIPLFIAQASAGQDLTVFGEEKVLDFTYLDDCVDGIRQVIENFDKVKGTTFNIASGKGASLVELAELLTESLDTDSQVHVEPSRTGEVTRYVADTSKAQKILDYEPTYSFAEGIMETVDWYTDNEHLFDDILSR